MFEKGQIIGRNYKVISRLGEGGMGLVYRALDVNLGREVAIKFLLPEIAKDEEIVKRFLNEGRVMATINHPAVISVYASDVEESNGLPFLVMEFVDGASLDKCQERLRSDPVELINHFIQLMSGIHSCHQKGIIHRDLKPENLLINREGQLKIVDFGIAKSATRHTKTGIALGTPHYMSPEQCLGKQDITAKTDIYAAGIMLFEVLTGTLPFHIDGHVDDPALTIALMHLNQAPDFSDFSKAPMGPEFRVLVEKMIAKKPEDRPEVGEILTELKHILRLLLDSERPTMAKEAVKARQENTIGEIYEIQSELGAGGMGKVYKALDTALNRTVAIKVLHDSTTKDKSVVDRFIQEGQVLATVGHRNVMGIYASSRDKKTGRPFLVMEYIEGKPLSKLKDVLAKDQTQAVPIMLQLAEGLAACHDKGIIHRDLKPGNIIITSSGIVKILDFGIAKTSANLTKTGMTVGTPEYMSPEQCTGSKNLSSKSDIYSLGIIFWEMIFGVVPFKADANTNPELSIALKHIEATLPAQAAIPDMSLVKIISLTRKMLDKDPEARPDMDYIIDTLEDYLAEHMPEALDRKTSGRRSMRRSTGNLSGLVESAAANEKSARNKSRVVPVLLILLVAGGFIAWKFGLTGSKSTIDYEKEINDRIAKSDFNSARRLLGEFQRTEAGKIKASFLKVALSKAMLEKADEHAKNLDYQKAIDLYARAIVLDPANPQAALNLSKLQQDFQKVEQQKARIAELKDKSDLLLANLEPASGTVELSEVMNELESLGFATMSNELAARWQTRFISKGSPFINDQPETALQYFEELQKYFPDLEGLEEPVNRAKQRSEELKEELEAADKVNSLKYALNAAIDNYTTSQKTDFLVKQIDKVADLGETEEAKKLKQKLAQKIAHEAEKLIINNPQKAIDYFEIARSIYPETEGLETRIQLANESLETLRSSEEMKIERDNLAKEISADIKKIVPPADTADLVAKIAKLEKYNEGPQKARILRNELFDKYFASVSEELERSPETARTILAYCQELNPNAPGLKELNQNIEEKIEQENARRKAEEEQQRAQRLETAKNAIYTGIKKDRIPEELEKIHAEISALSRDYPDSDAPEKLFDHLRNRCRDEIDEYVKKADYDQAKTTISIARKLLADDKSFLAFLDKSTAEINKKQQLEKMKKAVEKQEKAIDAFIRNPSLAKVDETLNNIAEIGKFVSSQEAEKAMEKVLTSLEKRFANSDNPKEAADNFALIEAFDKSYSGKAEQEIAQMAEKRLNSSVDFIAGFTPGHDVSEIKKRLPEFETWNRIDLRNRAYSRLKANYLKEIDNLKAGDPEEAFKLLASLMALPGLTNDDELQARANELKNLISTGKSQQNISNRIDSAKTIISRDTIEQNAEKLFEIIEYLKSNSPENASKIKYQIVSKLTDKAQNQLKADNLKEAEKTVILIKQFEPSNETAQKIQISIVNRRNELSKPKEFVVGPTGSYRTITEAITAAPNGMTIRVQPGTYNENLILSRDIKLVGESASRCSINSNKTTTILMSGNCSVQNLTITNSSGSPASTITIQAASPAISGCVLSNSSPAQAPNYNGVINVNGGTPVISGNQIIASKGMGITITAGSPVITKNTIYGCQIYGIWFNGRSRAQVTENSIRSNSKSGVGIKNGAAPSFSANLIENNGENGILIYAGAGGTYQGNRLSNNAFSGIEIWDAQPDSVANNIFDSNRRDALYIRGGKSVVKLGNNQFKNTRGENVKNSGGKIISM
ncbi:MAG: eukaryotic-like serine/threonine-protein kinase [Clostridiales bacterium]|nr:eukaryotic-like serine/threonine-protein kinase [Clostridiales bacterium]MDN5283194.1 eukaryotic-like serine/threonine-protein kinase [Candidatus Ozemobacter sp.]